MKLNNWICLMGLLLVGSWNGTLLAQDNDDEDLGDKQVSITKEAEVKIENAQRISFPPVIPEETEKVNSLKYEVPIQFLEFDYQPNALKPLAAPKEKTPSFKQSYIRLGFGTLISPLAEIRYYDNKNKAVNYGAYYDHFSAKGRHRNQLLSYHNAGIHTDVFTEYVNFGAKLTFNRDVHHFYGYNEEDTLFDNQDVKQLIRTFGGSFNIHNSQETPIGLDLSQDISFGISNNKDDLREYFVAGHTKATKSFLNNHRANFHIGFDVNSFKSNLDTFDRHIIDIGGNYTFDNDDWKLTAGLSAVSDDGIVYLFPNFVTEKRLHEHKLIFFSGWNRTLQKNSFISLTDENPYILDRFDLQNSRIEDRFAGFKGNLNSFDYHARFSNKVIKNMVLFVNDSSDTKRFDVLYEKNATVINLHLGMGYWFQDKFRLGINADYFRYETDQYAQAWHKPSYRVELNGIYNFKDKIDLTASIIGLSSRKTFYQGEVVSLKGAVDARLGISYQFSDYLNLFLNINNIGHQRYETYKNYNSFGFNALAGFKFMF